MSDVDDKMQQVFDQIMFRAQHYENSTTTIFSLINNIVVAFETLLGLQKDDIMWDDVQLEQKDDYVILILNLQIVYDRYDCNTLITEVFDIEDEDDKTNIITRRLQFSMPFDLVESSIEEVMHYILESTDQQHLFDSYTIPKSVELDLAGLNKEQLLMYQTFNTGVLQ